MAAIGKGVRASDAERDEVAERIRVAAKEGRLTLEETDDRLSDVFAAVYRDDLIELTADLPDRAVETPAPPPPRARFRFDGPLRIHAAVVAGFSVMFVMRWLAMGTPFFWPVFPIFWLVMSLLVHAAIRGLRAPGSVRPASSA